MAQFKLGANGETVRIIHSAPVQVTVPNDQYRHMQLCIAQSAKDDFSSRSAGADLADGASAMAFFLMIIFPLVDATCSIVDYLAQ